MKRAVFGLLAAFYSQMVFGMVDRVQLERYLDFIGEWTEYEYQGQALPEVHSVDHKYLQIEFHGAFEVAQAELKDSEIPQVLAIYDYNENTIRVSHKIDPWGHENSPTLVHELVHYMQNISGLTDSVRPHLICTESEAYDVQMLWQKLNNIRVDEIPRIYQESLLAATKCMGGQSVAFSQSNH